MPAAVFLVSLCAAVLVGEAARAFVLAQKPERSAQTRLVPPEGHYLANDIGGTVDHHVIYFGLDTDVLRHLRAAEVLFLGNSRLMFALRPRVLRPAFDRAQLTYYVLGFGHREADRFPLAIIRKFDLRPRLVVVNVDGFFGGGLSAWAETVHRDTPFAARKLRFEAESAHTWRGVVDRLVPNWPQHAGLPGLGLRRAFVAYRSTADGTWDVSPWPEATLGFARQSSAAPLTRGEIAGARAFKAELDGRGASLALTAVPTPEPLEGAGAERFAELLGVPLLVPEVPALTSHDHSHLSEGSAHDWSRALVGVLTPHLQAVARQNRPAGQ